LVHYECPKLTPQDTKTLLSVMMTEDQHHTFETQGEVDFSFSSTQVGRYRVNVFQQRGSMAASIRLIHNEIIDPRFLGIPDSVIDLYKRNKGLVLVTGATGSGKSTTLASLIDQINRYRSCHVITLEDPIEYLHKHQKSIVNQREIGLDSTSYGSALKAALRQDPDVILVGEMRDLETISTALTAAETGHLVFSTLHTSGAVETIDRIIDVFPPHQQAEVRVQLSSVLVSVISQQLLPKSFGEGRIPAFEVMHLNPAIRNLIREGKTYQIKSTIQTNRKMGMMTMEDALIQRYREGSITRETAVLAASDPISIEHKLVF
ncbi:MAG: type IV pilus twitching motility protein PilT, partial [Niameybacter sp.]